MPAADRGNDLAPKVRAATRFLLSALDGVAYPSATEDVRVTDALARSKIPLLRAIAAVRILPEPAKGNAATAVGRLTVFGPIEQLEVLADWIGVCRLEANRRGESQALVQQLQQFSRAMVECWPERVEKKMLLLLAKRMGGPGDCWSDSTTKDVFEPMIEVGKLEWDAVEDVWFGELECRLARAPANQPEKHQFFYSGSDRPLSRAFVIAYCKASPERRKIRRAALEKLRKKSVREFGSPFAKSRNYERWAAVSESLYWLKAIALLMRTADLAVEERAAWENELAALNEALESVESNRQDGAASFAEELSHLAGSKPS